MAWQVVLFIAVMLDLVSNVVGYLLGRTVRRDVLGARTDAKFYATTARDAATAVKAMYNSARVDAFLSDPSSGELKSRPPKLTTPQGESPAAETVVLPPTVPAKRTPPAKPRKGLYEQ